MRRQTKVCRSRSGPRARRRTSQRPVDARRIAAPARPHRRQRRRLPAPDRARSARCHAGGRRSRDVDTQLDDARTGASRIHRARVRRRRKRKRASAFRWDVYTKNAAATPMRSPRSGAPMRVMRSQLPWNAAGHSTQVDTILAAFDKPVHSTDDFGAGHPLHRQLAAFGFDADRADARLASRCRRGRRTLRSARRHRGGRRAAPFAVGAVGAAGHRARLAAAGPGLSRPRRALARRQAVRHRQAADELAVARRGAGDVAAARASCICRRDRLETAWSCYAHVFSAGTQAFSYDIDSIAAYAGDHDRAMAKWKSLYPDRIRTQHYEAMVADTEPQLRELLAFCGLDFDPACLRFHETQRAVRTASAAQVREPLRKDTARSRQIRRAARSAARGARDCHLSRR